MSEVEYWNDFYAENESKILKKRIPTQFAVFVLSEILGDCDAIVDIGCGNGRDTFFFAENKVYSIGIDQSEVAIQICNKLAVSNTYFIESTVSNRELKTKILSTFEKKQIKKKAIYSRFFVHAIDAATQALLLKLASNLLGNGELFFLEFRTEKDSRQEKVTAAHYRRFINPYEFTQDAFNNGFKVNYFVEGFGYAKYKKDDAYVARFILEKI